MKGKQKFQTTTEGMQYCFYIYKQPNSPNKCMSTWYNSKPIYCMAFQEFNENLYYTIFDRAAKHILLETPWSLTHSQVLFCWLSPQPCYFLAVQEMNGNVLISH